MSTFLWVMVITAVFNTAAIIFCAFAGAIQPTKPGHRALQALFTAGMGAWALWLIAKGAY